ncbi:MAG: tetratricopeptide repeat protein [Pseudomonadota bacterium]
MVLPEKAAPRRNHAWIGAAAAAGLALALGTAPALAQQDGAAAKLTYPSVFEMPNYAAGQHRLTLSIVALFQQKRYAEAEAALRKAIEQFPIWPVHQYNLGAALALQNRPDEALDSLEKSVDLGFASPRTFTDDPDLNSLRDLPRFKALLDRVKTDPVRTPLNSSQANAKARPVDKGIALVDADNTAWIPQSNFLASAFTFPDAPASTTVQEGGENRVTEFLNLAYRRGEVAGLHGVLYDNRDEDHSSLRPKDFPQLTHIEYSEAARAAKVHYGANALFLFNQITIGNSSTAVSAGHLWRSQPRLIMTTPNLIARSWQHYANNHLYLFPEHRDHDPTHGDVFPAMTPYVIVSQGSSSSDQPFLRAMLSLVAAFPPDVREFLKENRLIAPTMQMIFRSTLNSLETPEDYLTAKAHPSAFEPRDINGVGMVRKARELKAEEVPPQVRLTVAEEKPLQPGIDYFGPGRGDEVLFTTPGAIARIIRSTAQDRRMVVSASNTKDPNDRPLSFTWRVLRGDPDRVRIVPRSEDGATAEITIAWQERRAVPFNPKLSTDRVDIAVFADNGAHISAPAFVSFYFPPTQKRVYDADGRIQEIDYAAEDVYLDPALFGTRDWSDRYRYTPDGKLIGWDRTNATEVRQFTRHGALVVETDALGRAAKAQQVVYRAESDPKGQRSIVETPTGRFVVYRYADASDLLGTPEAAPAE